MRSLSFATVSDVGGLPRPSSSCLSRSFRSRLPADFRTELLQFPHGRHDNQIDSVSQFLN